MIISEGEKSMNVLHMMMSDGNRSQIICEPVHQYLLSGFCEWYFCVHVQGADEEPQTTGPQQQDPDQDHQDPKERKETSDVTVHQDRRVSRVSMEKMVSFFSFFFLF